MKVVLQKSVISQSRMFDVITETWNPITGCYHNCIYCWARRLATTRLRNYKRYRQGFAPRLNREEFKKKFNDGFVFVCDMGDIFSPGVRDEWVLRVLRHIRRFPDTTFLFLTKNPARYRDFLKEVPDNAVLGATIETDNDELYSVRGISKAPPPSERLKAMKELEWDKKFISIEPILDFTPRFVDEIVETKPLLVYVGYDNYDNKLQEPRLSETRALIDELRSRGINVKEKTIRRAWYE
jgi:DNA repair photolyase